MLGNMPYLQQVALSGRVLAFAGTVTLCVAILFSLTPMLRLSFANVRDGLSEGNRGYAGTAWRRLGANLIVVELATAVVLLVGAGLLGKSFYKLLHVEIGFQPDHLATVGVMAPDVGYDKDEQLLPPARKILQGVSAIPGVQSAALTTMLPVTYNGNTTWMRIVGRPFHGEHNEVNERDVSVDYFRTIGASLMSGRNFTETDDAKHPGVVIINRKLGEPVFPGRRSHRQADRRHRPVAEVAASDRRRGRRHQGRRARLRNLAGRLHPFRAERQQLLLGRAPHFAVAGSRDPEFAVGRASGRTRLRYAGRRHHEPPHRRIRRPRTCIGRRHG